MKRKALLIASVFILSIILIISGCSSNTAGGNSEGEGSEAKEIRIG